MIIVRLGFLFFILFPFFFCFVSTPQYSFRFGIFVADWDWHMISHIITANEINKALNKKMKNCETKSIPTKTIKDGISVTRFHAFFLLLFIFGQILFIHLLLVLRLEYPLDLLCHMLRLGDIIKENSKGKNVKENNQQRKEKANQKEKKEKERKIWRALIESIMRDWLCVSRNMRRDRRL